MKNVIIILLLGIYGFAFSQNISLKERAIEEYKKENYAKSIELMEKALLDSPNDAEIYYYLGRFNHYNAYDSRLLKGYNSNYTEKILEYFDKALQLNPDYGDAKYFYFAECGAIASKTYQNNKLEEVKLYYEKAYKKGVIPEWAIEIGRNTLNSCDSDAILFTAGDMLLNICWFIQLHYGYRKDVSVVPLALLDRPSFVMTLNNSQKSKYLRGVNIGLTNEQILEMHPCKWDTLIIKLQVTNTLLEEYSLPQDYIMDWQVAPDYTSNRIVSKIEGEIPHNRTYLSPIRAMLLSIIESNKWERPVYFTQGFDSFFLAGLDEYFQNCGLVSKLLPMKTNKTKWELDINLLEKLVLKTKLEKLGTIIKNNQPRASGIIDFYYYSYYYLATYYYSIGNREKITQIIDSYKENLMIGFNKEREEMIFKALEEIKKH